MTHSGRGYRLTNGSLKIPDRSQTKAESGDDSSAGSEDATAETERKRVAFSRDGVCAGFVTCVPVALGVGAYASCLAYSRVRHLSEWLAGITVLVVAYRAESVLVAMVVGVGTLLVIRGSGGAIVYSSLPGSSATVSTAASTAFTAYSIRSCASAALISGPITPNVTGVSLSRLTSLSLSAAVWVTT